MSQKDKRQGDCSGTSFRVAKAAFRESYGGAAPWRPMRALGSLLLGYLGLAIGCHCANAQSPAGRPLSMKDAVQLALRQNPQRLIARLIVTERNKDKNIVQSALLPQINVLAGDSVKSFNRQSISGGPDRVRVGPFQAIDAGAEFSVNLFNMSLLRQYQASRQDVKTATFQEDTVQEQITSLIVAEYLGILRAAANRDAAASRVELAKNQASVLTLTPCEHKSNCKTKSNGLSTQPPHGIPRFTL